MWKCNFSNPFFIPDVLEGKKPRDGEGFSHMSLSRSNWVVLPRNAVKLNWKSAVRSVLMYRTDVGSEIDTRGPELS